MWHFFKNLSLLVVSFLFLPIDTAIVVLAYSYQKIAKDYRQKSLEDESNRATVLITGMNMTKGLFLARMFHRRGHRVIGADCQRLSIGRVSCAVDKFYTLPSPKGDLAASKYSDAFRDIVKKEDVDLWISVSDVNTALEDALVKTAIEDATGIKCIQPDADMIAKLHEKDVFIDFTRSKGLPVPVTEPVGSKEDIISFLNRHGGLIRTPESDVFIVKPNGVDDVARFHRPLLPQASKAKTLARINRIPFTSPKSTYIMQEFIRGKEYCTHALVIRGHVRAFVACESAEVLLHYEALPPDSPLARSMLDFTMKQADALGPDYTGHLSFDFLAKDVNPEGEPTLLPIECNPRVHTATILFESTPQLVDEYLSILSVPSKEAESRQPLFPQNLGRYHWLAQDFVDMVLSPGYAILRGESRLSALTASWYEFILKAVFYQDGTFAMWDPWPFWWMCHVLWPVRFAMNLRWNQINVSTGKMFMGK